MYQLVLVRHGQSEANARGEFTGWIDSKLTPLGKKQALSAGQLLKKNHYEFDIAFTSFLFRAIDTLDIILETLGLDSSVKLVQNWRLNERHYGALQGINKDRKRTEVGPKQVANWRKGYDVLPPLMTKSHKNWSGNEKKYAHLKVDEIPLGESLATMELRVDKFINKDLLPVLKDEKKILIVAHKHILKYIIKHFTPIQHRSLISHFKILNGQITVFNLSQDLNLKPKTLLALTK